MRTAVIALVIVFTVGAVVCYNIRMPRPSSLTTETLKKAFTRIKAGEVYGAVAKDFGITYGSVLKKILERRGFKLPKRRIISPSLRLPRKQTDLAYIAGLFDGEGCLSVVNVAGSKKPTRRWMLGITNTDEKVIRWLASFGGYVVPRDRRSGIWKKCFNWDVARRADLILLLTALLPYLRIKRTRAQVALSELKAMSLNPSRLGRPAKH